MKSLNRRSFLQNSAFAAGAGLLAGFRPSVRAQPVGANGAIRLGVVGLGNKGLPQVKQLLTRKDVRVAALCDVDPRRLAQAAELAKAGGQSPFLTTEAREVIARRDVDAVVLVTSNHWHALHTIQACQAGKDVYVEKPMSHTVWEGRRMVEAAAKYRRIVQVGTQYRSETGLAEGIAFLHAGGLGRIKHVHCVVYARRESIGRRPGWYPDWLNYDAYCGPAPMVPLERNDLHHAWRWMWDMGNGDLGDNGVHIIDVALRVVRQTAAPRRLIGLGGRFGPRDAGQTPNTALAVYDYPDAPIMYEVRGLPAKPGVSYMDQTGNIRVGIVAHCEGGYLSGLTGCAAYDREGKVIRKFAGDGGRGHMGNFLEAMRSRRTEALAAPVETGHASASICHYGNISYRLGAAATSAQIGRALEGIPAAAAFARNLEQHLVVNGIDLAQHPFRLGAWLEVDAPADNIVRVESADANALERARYLLREVQRPPYAVPAQV